MNKPPQKMVFEFTLDLKIGVPGERKDNSFREGVAWENSVLVVGNAMPGGNWTEWRYYPRHIGSRFFGPLKDVGQFMP